jgi:Tfp pilus assembly protein PilF
MAGDQGRWTEARDHLARALERDEADRDVWAHLATVHRKLGDGAVLEGLERRFRERFGYALRPAW